MCNVFQIYISFLQLYCGFSGAVMIDQIYLMLYNLLFTSLPPLALGIYDRIAAPRVLLSAPELYTRGRLGLVYQPHSFWLTIGDALYQSLIIFFITKEVSTIYRETRLIIAYKDFRHFIILSGLS